MVVIGVALALVTLPMRNWIVTGLCLLAAAAALRPACCCPSISAAHRGAALRSVSSPLPASSWRTGAILVTFSGYR